MNTYIEFQGCCICVANFGKASVAACNFYPDTTNLDFQSATPRINFGLVL